MSDEKDDASGSMGWAKKLLTVGVGTFFLTEDALKTLVSEFKLPKEIVGTILDGAKSVRKEFMENVVAEMLSKVQDRIDPGVLVSEFFRKNEVTLEIRIKVKEKADGDGV